MALVSVSQQRRELVIINNSIIVLRTIFLFLSFVFFLAFCLAFCLVTCMYQCTSKVLVQVSANEPVHSILLFLVLREHNETNAVMSQCRDGVTVVL